MPKRTLNRRTFLSAVGSGAAVALAGCSSKNGSGTETGTSAGTSTAGSSGTNASSGGGGTLQLNIIQQQTLDPIGVKGNASGGADWQIFEQLMTFKDGLLPPVGLLAKDYSIADDNVTYTFTLKDGVKFHDGTTLTAGDVAYSLKRLAGSEHNRGNSSLIIGSTFTIKHQTDSNGDYVPGSLAVSAADDKNAKIVLEQPFHSTLALLGHVDTSIVPEGIVGDVKGYDGKMSYQKFATKTLTGTGPFEFKNWNQGQEINAVRFDDYHGETATIDGITWYVLGDPNAVYNRAMNKNLDMFDIPTSQFDPKKRTIEGSKKGSRKYGTYGPVGNGETLNYGEVTLVQTNYVLFNTLRVELAARQAMAYVMNQQTIVEDTYKGLGTPAYHLAPPAVYPGGTDAYNNHAKNKYPYGYNETKIDAAAKVMEKAGYSESNQYEATFTRYSDEDADVWKDIANRLRDKLSSAHIDLQIDAAPSTTVSNRAGKGTVDMFGTYDELVWPAPDSILRWATPSKYTWTKWGQGDTVSDAAKNASKVWGRYQNNKGPSKSAQNAREDVYVSLEEDNWADVTELPTIHPIQTRFSYDAVENLDMHGPMFAQRFNRVKLNR